MVLSEIQLFYICLSALLVGFGKTSAGGVGILAVLSMAMAIPGKNSPGVLLPMLVMADFFAVVFYRRHCQWRILVRMLPLTFVGVILGYFLIGIIPNENFGKVIGGLFLVMLLMDISVPDSAKRHFEGWLLTSIFGVLAGIATMIANAAGPVFAIYLLRMGLDKKEFVGTRAWYYLILNLFKVLFSVNLGLINLESFKLNLTLFPLILIGAFLGYWFLSLINLEIFKWLIRIAALLASIRLLFF